MKIEEPEMQEMMRGVRDIDEEEEEPQEVKPFWFNCDNIGNVLHRFLDVGCVDARLPIQVTSTVRSEITKSL